MGENNEGDNATRVFTLLRLFDKREYAESFRAGQLRMQRISYFRAYTDWNGELRGDSYEGIAGFIQPSEVGSITIAGHEILGTQLIELTGVGAGVEDPALARSAARSGDRN